ncbi:23S rRNA (adenine(1618)-N(6))-methyltransferase RlmF [Hymenobacter sp. BT770]|uniref:23S rRNA (adenine(1618)-N(6))-methyltransferase RlmF n=1 Tax=Hymenobacter sp. BT770 TaxID=2886942 RepID=UPI001D0F6404|nr:23S rRNA (adenine(1618)-N(6))-methyltransferase RlmF [Hymenobacter sp. BT770]MCC3154452.1 23S rRNA (adenine(1618)-N(6))-methyltransferase RlmF [Hymenobacter sp. BT770]MDO3416483.1 23S rRNA (adenine(1618)-N(6))-methyltransferase RlmF [Hymenobacter sp. BT770]
MKTPLPAPAPEKDQLHPRNPHRGPYDFPQLSQRSPELAPFVQPNQYGNLSIDFANPAAVKALNRALLRQFYGIEHWDIPKGYLCPPIPGRADYVHYLADLLAESNGGTLPPGEDITVLDVGVGANCIYPIIGRREYGWHFVGSDVDGVAVRAAQQIEAANPGLAGAIECRLQPARTRIFDGLIQAGEVFDLTMCNPPFHASAAAATAGSQRKTSNLGTARGPRPALNFGGQNNELWCEGGEASFIRRMVQESGRRPRSCYWYTSLVSKKETLPGVYRALKTAGATAVRTIDMAQGQKKSRLVAWTFLTPAQQAAWQAERWAKDANEG